MKRNVEKKAETAIKYKSKLEAEFAKRTGYVYEPFKVEYVEPETKHRYTPDFVSTEIEGPLEKMVVYEVKGRFRTIGEARKYLHVRNSNRNLEIVFVLASEKVRMPKSKKLMTTWLDENGFKWITIDNV